MRLTVEELMSPLLEKQTFSRMMDHVEKGYIIVSVSLSSESPEKNKEKDIAFRKALNDAHMGYYVIDGMYKDEGETSYIIPYNKTKYSQFEDMANKLKTMIKNDTYQTEEGKTGNFMQESVLVAYPADVSYGDKAHNAYLWFPSDDSLMWLGTTIDIDVVGEKYIKAIATGNTPPPTDKNSPDNYTAFTKGSQKHKSFGVSV